MPVSLSLPRAALAAIVLSAWVPAAADCAADLHGEVFCGMGRCVTAGDGVVWCSRYDRGDARLTLTGEARCGKGQCAENVQGHIYCSTRIGGAATVDLRGRVRCTGECEPATIEHCENSVAGRARN